MRRPLLVLGSLNADLYVEIERLPAPGETIAGYDAAMRPGGKGANQAATAARLGMPTAFAGNHGNDAFAQPLKQALNNADVDLDFLTGVDGPSGQAVILLQHGGENSIIIVGGANQTWTGINAALTERIRGSAALLLQREIPEFINVAAARIAHAAGVPVVLDAGGAEGPLPAEMLPLLHVLSPNETELTRLTGLPIGNDLEVERAARWLQQQGVGTVLVKLGARGAMLVPDSGIIIKHPVFPVPVIDTTGAGDCFTAAYVVAMIEDQSEYDRLRFACAAAALCIQSKGAMPSMPKRDQVMAFLAQQKSFR